MAIDNEDNASLLIEQKHQLRKQVQARRQQQKNRIELSERICQKLAELAEYVAAKTVMIYVGVRSEVQTSEFLNSIWTDQKSVVVPMCMGEELALFRVESHDELAPRTLGIPEPVGSIRQDPARKFDVRQVDLLVTPGVAFDQYGGRLGYGKGYFDRLLSRAEPETPIVGLGFESQIVAKIPMGPHDIFLDKVITEKTVYERTID